MKHLTPDRLPVSRKKFLYQMVPGASLSCYDERSDIAGEHVDGLVGADDGAGKVFSTLGSTGITASVRASSLNLEGLVGIHRQLVD